MRRRSMLLDFRLDPRRRPLLVATATLLALIFAMVWSSQRSAAATQGPVAEYSFDQNPGEGTMIEDLTGNGHTATIHGATWAEHGRYGGAMNFDAEEGDYLSVPDSEELALTEEFTLEAWVRPGSGENFWGPLIDKQIPGEEGLSEYAYFLYASDYVEDRPHGSMPEGAYLHAAGGTPKRVWSHIAMTYDGGTIRLYVDGQLVDEGVGTPPPVSEGELEIGGATEQGTYLDGRIDEVRIYDRALSGAEVDADMETPIGTAKTGPVAEYSFDEESGTAMDLSGHENEGTIEGAEWVPNGVYGGALRFDGEESCVTVPDSETLHPSEEFTLEAWVKPKDSPTADPIIFKAGEGTAKYAAVLGFENYGRPQGWVDGKELKGPESIGTDVWTNLAFTYDGDTLRLYVGGEVVDEEEVGELQLDTEGPEDEEPLYIGCDPPAWGNHFHGKIDEPRIYERALTPAEVGADMETPIQTPKNGPVAAWSFDEVSGGTVEDLTGNGHKGTIEGATPTEHGRFGGALSFDGEGDCVSVPSSEALQLNEEFTLEAWVEPEGPLSSDPIIFKESEGFLGYGLAIGSIHEGRPEGLLNAGGEDNNVFGPSAVEDDVWTHLAVTYDGRDLRLYVNGELVATRSITGKVTIGSGPLFIGCAPAYEESFKGRIDEPRIYERALTGGEVQQTMNSTFPSVNTDATTEVESEDSMMFGTVQVNGPKTEYYFQYGSTTSYGEIANGEELAGDGESVEVEQTAIDLAPETQYHYRLVVEGPFGTSYGKDETFTTGPPEEEVSALAEASHEAGEFFGINWDGDLENMLSTGGGRNNYKRIEESGAKYVRINIYPGFPYKVMKESFEQAEKHHLKVLPYIGEGNIPTGGGRTETINVVKELVAEFGPGTESDTRIWEIGNEPNLIEPGLEPENEVEQFARYYEDMANEVRTVNKSTEFLLPGLFGYKKGGSHISAREYLKKLMAALASPKVPLERPYVGVSIHPYVFKVRDAEHPNVQSHRPSTPEDAVELTKEVQRTVAGIHSLVKKDGLPIWVTELGFPLGSNKSAFPPVKDPKEQARLVRQTFSRLLEKRHHLHIAHAFSYNIQTRGSENVWFQRCGLFDAARQPYEAWSKFMEVVEEE